MECECRYCSGLRGDYRINQQLFAKYKRKMSMEITYDAGTGTMFFQTEVGGWKIFRTEESKKYRLYHKNTRDLTKEYHRQWDVKETGNIDKILRYITEHDRAKAIIADDYRKLPKTTKKQKKYYRIAEQRDKRQSYRRVEELFAQIEGNGAVRG